MSCRGMLLGAEDFVTLISMRPVDESLFAVLQIVGLFLAPGHPKQKHWYDWIVDHQGLTPDQKRHLHEAACDLEPTFRLVNSHDDRRRLLDWAHIARDIDAPPDENAQQLYAKLQGLVAQAELLSDPQSGMADGLVHWVERERMWRELLEIANLMRQRAGLGNRANVRRLTWERMNEGNHFLWWAILLPPVLVLLLLFIFHACVAKT